MFLNASQSFTQWFQTEDTGFSALLPFSFFLQDFFYALIPLVKLLPFLPSKQEKTDASEGHTVRI